MWFEGSVNSEVYFEVYLHAFSSWLLSLGIEWFLGTQNIVGLLIHLTCFLLTSLSVEKTQNTFFTFIYSLFFQVLFQEKRAIIKPTLKTTMHLTEVRNERPKQNMNFGKGSQPLKLKIHHKCYSKKTYFANP